MDKDFSLRSESLEAFMRALASDPEEAGVRYELLRLRLVAFFRFHGMNEPFHLADLAIDRMAERHDGRVYDSMAELKAFAVSVARFIRLEQLKIRRQIEFVDESYIPDPVLVQNERDSGTDARETCLMRCLDKLPEKDRELILAYYSGAETSNAVHRKNVAEAHGATVNNVYTRVSRIRKRLDKCIEDCMGKIEV